MLEDKEGNRSKKAKKTPGQSPKMKEVGKLVLSGWCLTHLSQNKIITGTHVMVKVKQMFGKDVSQVWILDLCPTIQSKRI